MEFICNNAIDWLNNIIFQKINKNESFQVENTKLIEENSFETKTNDEIQSKHVRFDEPDEIEFITSTVEENHSTNELTDNIMNKIHSNYPAIDFIIVSPP